MERLTICPCWILPTPLGTTSANTLEIRVIFQKQFFWLYVIVFCLSCQLPWLANRLWGIVCFTPRGDFSSGPEGHWFLQHASCWERGYSWLPASPVWLPVPTSIKGLTVHACLEESEWLLQEYRTNQHQDASFQSWLRRCDCRGFSDVIKISGTAQIH